MGGERPQQKKFNRLMEKLKNDEFKYTPKEEKEIDWAEYAKAPKRPCKSCTDAAIFWSFKSFNRGTR